METNINKQEYNYKILEKLKELVDQHPDYGFGQILYNYTPFKGNHDPFYDDPKTNYQYIINVTTQNIV